MDIFLQYERNHPSADWTIDDGDLRVGNPLLSAVMISLFTDALASDDLASDGAATFVPDGAPGSVEADRMGWWGDTPDTRGIGSRLWQMTRGIKIDDVTIPRRVETVAGEALHWLIEDGVASSIDVKAQWHAKQTGTVLFEVVVSQPGIAAPSAFRFSWAWNGLI